MAGLIGTSGAEFDWQRVGCGAAVSALVVILVTESVLYVRVQAQRRKDLPPGPRPWPVLGNLPILAVAMPHLNLQKLAFEFGPLVYLRLGSLPCVVVSTAEAAKTLVRADDEHLSSRPKLLSFDILTQYKTMATAPSPGKLWHALRRFSSKELLSVKRIASYEGTRREELSNMMQVLLNRSNGGEAIDLKHWLFQTAANVVSRMLINKRIYYGNDANSYQEEVLGEFNQWVQDRVKYIAPPILSDYVPWLRFFSQTVQGWRSKISSFADREDALLAKMLELEKRRQRAALKEGDESYVPDFVDVMLAAPVDDGKVFGDTYIIRQTAEFFAAGVETGSTTTEWAMAELVVRPEVMQRAQKEIDAIVGLDRLVQESDIPKLSLLQAIVKETYRLHPSLPISLPRESSAPVEALGYKIAAGTRIIYNQYSIHRDPSVYENPDEFNPNRFLHQHLQVNPLTAFDSFELIPFGVGRRICPGYNLGNTVVHFMLANLIHSYDWSLPNGASIDLTDTIFSPLGTLYLRSPLTLVPKLRDGVPAF